MNKFFNIIKSAVKKSINDDISGLSAQFTYYLILALFPFAILLIYLFGLYQPAPNSFEALNIVVPDEINQVFSRITNDAVLLSKTPFLSVTIITALWTASLGSIGIIKGVNKCYEITETRGYFKLRLCGLVLTAFLIFSVQVTLVLIVIGNNILFFIQSIVKYSDFFGLILNFLRFIISITLLTLVFSFIYKFAPPIKLSFIKVIPGAIFTSIGWITASYFFSYYVDNYSSYANLYGNLSSVFILIIWVYITGYIFLFGSELNAIISKENDTTK